MSAVCPPPRGRGGPEHSGLQMQGTEPPAGAVEQAPAGGVGAPEGWSGRRQPPRVGPHSRRGVGGDGPGPEEVALISCAGHPALAAQGSGGALLSEESGCCPGRCGRTKFSCSRRRILTSDQTYLTKG